MKLFLQKNAKFSSAWCSAPRPPRLRRLGVLPPDPQPPAAEGFASRPPLASGGWGLRPQTPKTAHHCEFFAKDPQNTPIGLRRQGFRPKTPKTAPQETPKTPHCKPQIAFESIENPLQHSLEKEDFSDLSSDQRLLHEYTKGIGSGKVDEKYSSWKIGQLHHARWLTLAIRLFAVYTREESPSGNLNKLVHYILKVYAPSWFEIKSSSKLHESPRKLFQNLSRIDQLSFEDLNTIAKQNLQGNSFCLLPENFLYALIKDEDPIVRNLGLQTIINLRSKNR